MLKNISWHSFVTGVVVTMIVYYIIIGVLYFKGDVMQLFKEGIKRKEKPAPFSAVGTETKGEPTLFSATHELMNELKDLFFTASGQGYPKEELITALHSKLKNYQILKDTKFEASINEHIIQTALSICNIELDATDMKRIW